MRFSNAEKAQECRRELGKRRHVYPRAVSEGKMKQDAADRLIALMEDIQADYEALDRQDRPDMFATPEANKVRAVELAAQIRNFARFGETPARAKTMLDAAELLEVLAR